MKTKTIVTAIVAAVLLIAVLVGAAVIYNTYSNRAMPDDLLHVIEQPGQQTGKPEEEPEAESEPETKPDPDPEVTPPAPSEEPDLEDYRAPDFTVQDVSGNDVNLYDMLEKPVVLNFWASWCPPCKSEMPEFDKVFEELGEDIQFMMVCLTDGHRETVATGAAYIADNGYTFPVYYDVYGEAAENYSVWSIPATYFIDAKGYLAAEAQGAINEETLRMGIDIIR